MRTMRETILYDFYPRPPRGGRRQPEAADMGFRHISIHALREEGDMVSPKYSRVGLMYFYPRPPRGGRPCSPFCE